VAKGELEDIEDHRAGPPVGTIRAVGSVQPTKKGRTPFTAEDDRILMEWCAKAERKGLSLKGNDLYKQLEAKVRLYAKLYWRNMLTYGCRIAGTLSSHGGITGSKTFLLDRDLRYLKPAGMKMMRTNLPKTTVQSLDNPYDNNM
jgi:Rap1 Myb domain